MHETEHFSRLASSRTAAAAAAKHGGSLTAQEADSPASSPREAAAAAALGAGGDTDVEDTGVGGGRLAEILSAFRRFKWHVAGTAGSWFIFDVVFYAQGLFQAEITETMGLGADAGAEIHDQLRADAKNALIIAFIMLPGYFLSVCFLDRIGRRNIQALGFAMLGVLFLAIGWGFDGIKGSPGPLLLLYGLTYLFANFGPNATTYIIPGELYPTAVRATCHGLSAASGKIGAAIGGVGFESVKNKHGIKGVMVLCGLLGIAGLLWTLAFTPAYTADDLAAAARRARSSKGAGEAAVLVPLQPCGCLLKRRRAGEQQSMRLPQHEVVEASSGSHGSAAVTAVATV